MANYQTKNINWQLLTIKLRLIANCWLKNRGRGVQYRASVSLQIYWIECKSTYYKSYQTMKYVAVARNTQTNDADLRSLQNLLRKLLQGQNNHLTRRHFNQHFFWGKNAPAQIHFQVCKFSKVAFLRLLIVFPCFSGSFAFHVFWIVHSNILSCFKSLLKFTEPQRNDRKGKSAQVLCLVARFWDGLWNACQLPPWDRWTLVCEATPDHR